MTAKHKAIFLLIACGGGLYAWRAWNRRAEPTYQTTPIERGDVVSTVTANGTCSALLTVQVSSLVSGNIKTLYADFNSRVRKGDLLAEVDPAPFIARVDQAKAALDSAEAALKSAQAVRKKTKADIAGAYAQEDTADAAIKLAESSEKDSESKLVRRERLGDVISPEDLETARTTHEVAVADREAAAAQRQAAGATLAANQDQYQSDAAQVDQAQDQVAQAKAALEQAQLDLAHTRIASPIDGIVISRDVDVGQTVAVSFQAPTLFEIAQDLSQMQVDMNVDESDVSRVRVGQEAQFTVDALPGTTFHAIVKEIRKAPTNIQNVITYDVILTVLDDHPNLLPGMTANVRVVTARHANVLRVRNTAFLYRPSRAGAEAASSSKGTQKAVYMQGANHEITRHVIEAGISDGAETEIVSGDVKEGDLVVTAEIFHK